MNGSGTLFIYSLADKPPKLVKQVETGSAGILRDIAIDYARGYIFTCAMDGAISVLESGKPGKDRFTKLLGFMKGTDKARCVCWRPSKLELVTAYENGQVAFWRIQAAQVSFVFEPHGMAVTKIYWDETRQVLYTASKDKSIKVWKVPDEWHVYFAKKEEKKEPVVTTAVVSEKKERAGSDSDSGDDDLKGWAGK